MTRNPEIEARIRLLDETGVWVAKGSKVYLLSTSIIPSGFEGVVVVKEISKETAVSLLTTPNGYISAVGHKSTAQALSTLLGMPIEANRVTVEPKAFDTFVCFQLRIRPPEGAILDLEQLEEIGYSLRVLEFKPPISSPRSVF